ncbi:hypothetical protein KIH39_19240 [Telmatocola sphagniphila]|uniref:Thioredoxin domain-containing protein n=1 Tax=Telmatocola sphagniphila TaxID=1123043 RepID=A0A8E6B456_9BACT|nr:hypothetical protein [Telmatocola sphagniphila]QVL30969.1 hypothetical protein KIH39_19240 [Telmatocola sphagniphila]
MNRLRFAFLGFLLLTITQLAPAADTPAKGNWKLSLPIPTQQGEMILNMLVSFSEAKGKWVGDVLDMSPQLKLEPSISAVTVKDDLLQFDMLFGSQTLSFDGKFTKDGKKLRGSLIFGGNTLLMDLYPSKLKNLKDEFALAREVLEQQDGQAYLNSLLPVLKMAGKKSLKVEEVRGYTDRAMKETEVYGNRFQRTTALTIAGALADQEPYAAIALEQARQAERMLADSDDASTQMSVLEGLRNVLVKTKKLDEAKKVELQLVKAEARDYAEYSKKMSFQAEAYAGRKAKSDRVVLVEMFTGAECPPCVAADLAFEALDKSYKPTEVVLMQYHLHVPGPDPMTMKDCETRAGFYEVKGTPSIYFEGKSGVSGGGPAAAAKAKNKSFRETIDEELEKPAGAKLQLTATRKGSEINLTAKVEDLKKPAAKTMLRFAITEDRVRYAGGNGIRYHHAVVRAFPGGANGFPLPKATGEQSVKLNLDELRASLNKQLDEVVKENKEEFSERPMSLKNLKAIAFIQDDTNNEILQAIQVDLEDK